MKDMGTGIFSHFLSRMVSPEFGSTIRRKIVVGSMAACSGCLSLGGIMAAVAADEVGPADGTGCSVAPKVNGWEVSGSEIKGKLCTVFPLKYAPSGRFGGEK